MLPIGKLRKRVPTYAGCPISRAPFAREAGNQKSVITTRYPLSYACFFSNSSTAAVRAFSNRSA
jgi:hypothetical protein